MSFPPDDAQKVKGPCHNEPPACQGVSYCRRANGKAPWLTASAASQPIHAGSSHLDELARKPEYTDHDSATPAFDLGLNAGSADAARRSHGETASSALEPDIVSDQKMSTDQQDDGQKSFAQQRETPLQASRSPSQPAHVSSTSSPSSPDNEDSQVPAAESDWAEHEGEETSVDPRDRTVARTGRETIHAGAQFLDHADYRYHDDEDEPESDATS
ncbi:MAG: hypothetical protein Q9159_007046 [Coniocarpon cinnabarinum]